MQRRILMVAVVIGLALSRYLIAGDDSPAPTLAPMHSAEALGVDGTDSEDFARSDAAPASESDDGLAHDAAVGPEVSDSQRLLDSPIVRARLEHAERLEVATARFDSAVQDSRVDVEDMNRSVVAMFESVELEPKLQVGGQIESLEIRSLDDVSPLALAGFAVGDGITEINDKPLGDPAELPTLLVGLERSLSICALRGSRRICRDISLD